MSECGIIGEVDNQVALFLLLDEAFMNEYSHRSYGLLDDLSVAFCLQLCLLLFDRVVIPANVVLDSSCSSSVFHLLGTQNTASLLRSASMPLNLLFDTSTFTSNTLEDLSKEIRSRTLYGSSCPSGIMAATAASLSRPLVHLGQTHDFRTQHTHKAISVALEDGLFSESRRTLLGKNAKKLFREYLREVNSVTRGMPSIGRSLYYISLGLASTKAERQLAAKCYPIRNDLFTRLPLLARCIDTASARIRESAVAADFKANAFAVLPLGYSSAVTGSSDRLILDATEHFEVYEKSDSTTGLSLLGRPDKLLALSPQSFEKLKRSTTYEDFRNALKRWKATGVGPNTLAASAREYFREIGRISDPEWTAELKRRKTRNIAISSVVRNAKTVLEFAMGMLMGGQIQLPEMPELIQYDQLRVSKELAGAIFPIPGIELGEKLSLRFH